MQTCPLFELQKSLGAVFTPHAGFAVPSHYGDPAIEAAAARRSCVVVDVSYQGKLRVEGGDRLTVLEQALAGDVSGLTPGSGVHTLALTRTGRILTDMVVYALDGWHLLELGAEATPRVVDLLTRLQGDADVTVRDLSRAWGLLALQGPESAEALSYLGIGRPPEGRIGTASLAGHPALVAGRRRTALPGFDLFTTAAALVDCWNSVLERGILPAGLDALNALRVEAGIPWVGSELSERVTPAEAGLEAALSERKRSFVGRDAVIRARRRAPVRQLGLLAVEGDQVPCAGAGVYVGSRRVGEVTSAVRSFTGAGSSALAYLRRGWGDPGVQVLVDIDGGRLPARVTPLPAAKE